MLAIRTVIFVLFVSGCACAQHESRIANDFRREAESLKICRDVSFYTLINCGQTLVTGQPIHLALGSMAPQNGFAVGGAFVENKNYRNGLRLNLNIDAVASVNGSWRGGAYPKAFRLTGGTIMPITSTGSGKASKIRLSDFVQGFDSYQHLRRKKTLSINCSSGLAQTQVSKDAACLASQSR